jgi:hypothetical protein
LATGVAARTVVSMPSISAPRPAPRVGSLVIGTLLGAGLVAAGLGFAYLTLTTPFVSHLLPGMRPGSTPAAIGMAVWSLAIVTGGALLVAGTNHLAAIAATLRGYSVPATPVARALRSLPDEIVVATGITPNEGRPIPELVIGPFGVAIVHEIGPRGSTRRIGASWETRTADGWMPTENPLDRVARDAERVRRWLTQGDLDFVVRVYAALVVPDGSIPRSPLCAVITPDQIPEWIAALPSQRSLSAGRRHHLLAFVRTATTNDAPRRDW